MDMKASAGLRVSHVILVLLVLLIIWLALLIPIPSAVPNEAQTSIEGNGEFGGDVAIVGRSTSDVAGTEREYRGVVEDVGLTKAVKAFEASIKSCLGAQCFDEKSTQHPISRIGFLSPDTHGVDKLLDLVLLAGKKAKLIDDGKRSAEVSTNVPAYGYGKNHGWSRIVRIVSKVPEHALKVLERNRQESPSQSLYAAQLEQLMRWHCRLNHVAAHSSMLSVFTEDLLERPSVEIYKILSFMGVRPSQYDIEEALQRVEGRQALTALSESFGVVPNELVATAVSQMTATTQKLSKWPCDSFRELESTSGEVLPLPCKTLHPDCDSQLVSCLPLDKRGMCS